MAKIVVYQYEIFAVGLRGFGYTFDNPGNITFPIEDYPDGYVKPRAKIIIEYPGPHQTPAEVGGDKMIKNPIAEGNAPTHIPAATLHSMARGNNEDLRDFKIVTHEELK